MTTDATPLTGEPDRTVALCLQATALLTRYAGTGEIGALHQAVAIGLRALGSDTGGGSSHFGIHRPTALASFANILRTRFEALGNVRDLNDAVSLGRAALATGPSEVRQVRGIAGNLSLCLRIRGQIRGSLADIDEAIAFGERAAALTLRDDLERAPVLSNLGGAYQVKYERYGDLDALDQAIIYGREALRSRAADGSVRAAALSNLGSAVQTRAERLGDSQDLAEAVDLARAAVAATSASDPAKAARLANLATACVTSFDHGGSLADLDEAVRAGAAALRGTRTDDPARPGRAANLSAVLRTRFERTGNEADLEAALTAARRATAAVGTARTAALSNLGAALRARYQRRHEAADALEAAGAFRAAIDAVPLDDPDRATLLSNLGATLYEYAEHEPNQDLAGQAEQAFRLASAVVTARPRVRVATSTSWGRIAAEYGRWESADAGLGLAVELLGRLVPPELSRADQQREIRRHFAVAADAAACAIERADASRALVLLEMGRGLLIRQTVDARADLGQLARQAPDLASELARLRGQLNSGRNTVSIDARHQLIAELERTLERIRLVPGFARFLRLPSAGELLPLAEHGPVVMLNVSELRSDALVLRPGSVSICPLPDVSPLQVQAQAAALITADQLRQEEGSVAAQDAAEAAVTSVLEWLWNAIARPVLADLDLVSSWRPGGPQSRIWWIPTGLLSFLPLHAAQDQSGDCLLDHVISSYAPTLHALGFARRAPAGGETSLFAVASSSLPGLADLPAARREARAVTEQVTCPADLLTGSQATREAVLREMQSHSWAHFACHATMDPLRPSEGALMIYGAATDPLTVADVTRLDLSKADVAFLSACTTARSAPDLTDESIHLAAAFQLAGYRHAVGTLWPVSDSIALRAVRVFYKRSAVSGEPRADRVAAAVHQTAQELRRRYPRQPSCWATYVHLGA